MADSTADESTNADTLWRELHKVLPEIWYDGGGKDHCEIDEAIRILTCLRKIESKNPESDISPVEVPKEFICTLSNKIMIEPMLIASGQTFEKSYILEWLKHERTCPRTKQVLYHRFMIPNHLINEVIKEWCRIHNFDRPKTSDEVIDLFTGDLESLLQRISCPTSVEDQTEAAKELSLKAKRFSSVCVYFVAKIPDSITRLLTPLSISEDSNPEFLENIVTALHIFSTFEKNKTLVAENPLVLPLLAKSMKQGTVLTRIHSAATVNSLSYTDSNKIIIGNSEVLKALIHVIEEGDSLATSEAFSALSNLCPVKEISEKAVSEGLIRAAIKKIKAGSNVSMLLSLLAFVSTQNHQTTEEMDNLGLIYDLFSILRNSNSLVNDENAVVIVYNICKSYKALQNVVLREEKRDVVLEEENKHGTFTRLENQEAGRATSLAKRILEWILRLLTPLSDVDSNPELQENIVTSLFNISTVEKG
ncbi:U box domain [Arabidopsis thaliana x Arabidopsis arenosa]|uniref:U box domain n=1 Tax=Arabidopsis thaliana x Arabidopsis arenosa TaxID=1240361 RepID=A0A8T2CW93_9BRAS|nr:U box domain [Arabidopsis thaliana x Arabidopsis arenosa]